MDIQFVSRHSIRSHGATYLRCVQPANLLRKAGYRVSVDTIYRSRPIANKAIILQRVAYDSYTRAFINFARARAIPLIYDIDDLLFNEEGSSYLAQGQKAAAYRMGYQPFATAMRACDHVSVSTQFLAGRAAQIHPQTSVVKNTLGETYLQLSSEVVERRRRRKSDFVTLAYLSGSSSHDADFAVIQDALFKVLQKCPQTRLLLVGPLKTSAVFDAFGERVIREDFRPYSDYPRVFENIDINLIPLEIEQPFCQAKSELKFIEAGACEVVSIATPTASHRSAIRHGENGLLSEADDWEASLIRLVENETMREALGIEARQTVLLHYTPEQSLSLWIELIESVTSQGSSTPITHIDRVAYSASLKAQYWKLRLRRTLSKIANT